LTVKIQARISISSGAPTPHLPFGTTAFDTSRLSLILAATDTESCASNTHSLDTIHSKLALYAYIVGDQQFSVLSQMFADNAIAN
jgi:hypothetical protein